MSRTAIWRAIESERSAQELKWHRHHAHGFGSCASADVPDAVKVAVLAEECGEVARAMLELDPEALRTELIQVAAVAVAWLEGIS